MYEDIKQYVIPSISSQNSINVFAKLIIPEEDILAYYSSDKRSIILINDFEIANNDSKIELIDKDNLIKRLLNKIPNTQNTCFLNSIAYIREITTSKNSLKIKVYEKQEQSRYSKIISSSKYDLKNNQILEANLEGELVS